MNEIKLENLDTYKVGISFSWLNMRVLIHRTVLTAIGRPQYLRFLLNVKEKKLAIQASNLNEAGAIPVPWHILHKESCVFNSVNLAYLIWSLCGWEKKKSYRVYGYARRSYKLVEFDLGNAECLTADANDDIDA